MTKQASIPGAQREPSQPAPGRPAETRGFGSRTSADLFQVMAHRAQHGLAFSLAVVLRTDGSTPCPAGSKAVIDADGTIHGTIGGGLVEAAAKQRARQVIQEQRAAVFNFALQGAAFTGSDPICGGRMRVLLDPLNASSIRAYAAAAAAQQQRERGALLTWIGGSDPCAVEVRYFPAASLPGDQPFPGDESIRAALQEETPAWRVSADATREVLIEPLLPCPRLLIVGGGHVGQAVAAQASQVGFAVTVLDDRPEFTAPELFPDHITTCCGDVTRELAAFPWSADTYAVLVTRGHRCDAEALAACLRQPAAYLGMIGSRRKVAMMRQDFLASGRATAAEFDRVYAPIGLDLGSVTVPEIATSIVAQLIAVRRTGQAGRMRRQ